VYARDKRECNTTPAFSIKIYNYPKFFTPNGDGINDVFMPILTGVIDTLYSFTVFNRWGGKVYQGRSITDFWDGKYMNEPAMQDAYIWLLSGKFIDGTFFEEKGNVTLLK